MDIVDKFKSMVGKFINYQEPNVVINLELDGREAQKFHDAMIGDTGPNVQRREWENYRSNLRQNKEWESEFWAPPSARDRYQESSDVAMMRPDVRDRHYQKTLANHGLKDLRELDNAVMTWRSRPGIPAGELDEWATINPYHYERNMKMGKGKIVTPEQVKNFLESATTHALSLNQEDRKKYYLTVQEKQGQLAVDGLVAAVKKQRTKSNALEM